LYQGRKIDNVHRRHDRLSVRLGILFSTFLIFFSVIFARCAWLTIAQGEEGVARQSRYSRSSEWVPARRGMIVDGRGFILARDCSRWVIAIDPWGASGRLGGRKRGVSREQFEVDCSARIKEVWTDLCRFEGFVPLRDPVETLAELIRDQNPTTKRQYRVVGTLDSVEAYQRFLRYRDEVHRVRGSSFPLPREESVREYPLGELALQVVGDRSRSGTALFGLELAFEEVLTGQRGIEIEQVDAIGRNRYSLHDGDGGVGAISGKDLELTLEVPAQLVLEKVLEEALQNTGARMVSGLVMDPRDGGIVAAASFPTCARGTFGHYFHAMKVPIDSEGASGEEVVISPSEVPPGEEHLWIDKTIVDPEAFDVQLMPSLFAMEPGSTMKPLVLARALDLGEVTLDTPVPVTGRHTWIRYGRANRKYTDSHVLEGDECNVRGAVVQSSNGGMGYVAKVLGSEVLRDLLRDLQFGEYTGIDLSEERGRRPGQWRAFPWTDHTTLSIPIGYEFLVTQLQLARAFSAIANGGSLVTPHLVRKVNGRLVANSSGRTRIFSEKSTKVVREVLRDAVKIGTGKGLRGDAIRLAGKTGTAKHYDLNGAIPGKYTSTFAGFAPFDDPRYVIVITVDLPQGQYYASKTAAPAACQILQALLGDEDEDRFAELLSDALAGAHQPSIISTPRSEEDREWGAADSSRGMRGSRQD